LETATLLASGIEVIWDKTTSFTVSITVTILLAATYRNFPLCDAAKFTPEVSGLGPTGAWVWSFQFGSSLDLSSLRFHKGSKAA
jgi:hypothetical protein